MKRFVNTKYTSNTYLVGMASEYDAILVDAGVDIAATLVDSKTQIKAILLTHPHYDHVYYLSQVLAAFPSVVLYAHPDTIKAIRDPKLNLSYYHHVPISVDVSDFTALLGKLGTITVDQIRIQWVSTPGHHEGAITYSFADHLFTGDSFVPGQKVVTKLKGGDRKKAQPSLSVIQGCLTTVNFVAPGHGPIVDKQFLLPEDFIL